MKKELAWGLRYDADKTTGVRALTFDQCAAHLERTRLPVVVVAQRWQAEAVSERAAGRPYSRERADALDACARIAVEAEVMRLYDKVARLEARLARAKR